MSRWHPPNELQKKTLNSLDKYIIFNWKTDGRLMVMANDKKYIVGNDGHLFEKLA